MFRMVVELVAFETVMSCRKSVVQAMRFVSQAMAFLKSCWCSCHFNRELVCDVVNCLRDSGRGHGELRGPILLVGCNG